jgi:hypothetical protein
MGGMSHATAADQVATHDEVVAQRVMLRRLAREHGLAQPRVPATGTVIAHSDSPGYRAVRAVRHGGIQRRWRMGKCVTDEVPAARVDAAAL